MNLREIHLSAPELRQESPSPVRGETWRGDAARRLQLWTDDEDDGDDVIGAAWRGWWR